MRPSLILLCAIVALAAFTGCRGGGKDDSAPPAGTQPAGETPAPDGLFFPPDDADALAHAALPQVSDLPGTGWDVTARDEFDNDSEEDEFDRALANEPACTELNAFESLEGVFDSGGGGDLPAGRAQIEFIDARSASPIPRSVEVSVEIERTVSEGEGALGVVKDLLESEEMQACLLAAFNAGFAEFGRARDAQITVMPRQLSAEVPNDGATIAYDIDLAVASVQLDLAMEVYVWALANATTTVVVLGPPDAVNNELIAPVLASVDARLTTTAESASP
jgi:hypothetical protein